MALSRFKLGNLKRLSRLPSSIELRKNHLLSDISNESKSRFHEPVMVKEVVEHLNLEPGNVFLDMTFGAGGHTLALLERVPGLHVLALDRDPVAREFMDEINKKYPQQITPLQGKFSDLPQLLAEKNVKHNSVDGVLFDVGCSSMQLDNAERGFSFRENGPLDMRMSCDREPRSLTAADVVAHASEIDLNSLFRIYGQERQSRKIARAIVQARLSFAPLKTTKDLSDLVETVCTGVRYDKLNRKTHIATKVFQALRIFVNNELNELNYGLSVVQKYLKYGGRAVVLTFHSLEDTIVKRHFRNQMINNESGPLPVKYFDCSRTYDSNEEEMIKLTKKFWNEINKKVICPTDEEVSMNPRSRSAKLRAAIKIKSNSEDLDKE